MSFVIQRVIGRQISLSEIRTDVLRIGRGTNAELRSDNPAVALEHAVIAHDSAGYTITDKGSITGTYVNGKPVESARLAKGDVIEIGDLKVDVQVADAAKPLFLRIVTKPKRAVSQAAPIIEEEDAPATAPLPGGGRPVRAPRVDYAAAYRLGRVYLTKLTLAALALIVTFLVVSEVTKPRKQKAFMPGGVSSAHARARDAKGEVIAHDCNACHAPWKSVQDERCVVCHTRVVHSETEAGTPSCMTCHTEHRGLPKLALVDDRKCASCHANLLAHVKPEVRVANRGSNPRYPLQLLSKITAFGVDHPDLVAPPDPNNLRFNHKLHLKSGGIFNGEGKREELTCAACHSLAVVRGKSDPVALNYEQHCQRCHKLTFDQRFATAEVPHVGDPQLVYGFVTSTFAGNRDILGKSPDEVRRLLSRRAVVAPGERAFYAAEQLVKNKCGKCHELTKAGNRWVAQPPVIRTSWFPGTEFTHTPGPHRGDCESCHAGARNSTATSDVHMPAIGDCASCHGPGRNVTVSSCLTCHEYHVRSRPLLASVTAAAPAGGSPGGSGGKARMIDQVLLIAIALLLVVVLVPIGVALYQRIKPRRDERPEFGGAPRPAPPPLPPPPAPSRAAAEPPPPVPEPAGAVRSASPPTVAGNERTSLGGKASGSTEYMDWYGMLLCTSGPLEGQRFVIEEKGFYIGRDASVAQVVVNDSRVSKRHVRIVPRGAEVWALDAGSTNGTFMGSSSGPRITEVQLTRGDTIVLADNAATFVYQV